MLSWKKLFKKKAKILPQNRKIELGRLWSFSTSLKGVQSSFILQVALCCVCVVERKLQNVMLKWFIRKPLLKLSFLIYFFPSVWKHLSSCLWQLKICCWSFVQTFLFCGYWVKINDWIILFMSSSVNGWELHSCTKMHICSLYFLKYIQGANAPNWPK